MKFLRFYYTKANREYYPSSSIKVFRKGKQSAKPESEPSDLAPEPPDPILGGANSGKRQTRKLPKWGNLAAATSSKQTTDNPSKETYCDASTDSEQKASEFCANVVKVQMISENLYKQIFPKFPRASNADKLDANRYITELRKYDINVDSTETIKDVQLELPPLRGQSIEQHFYDIAKEQIKPYETLLLPLVQIENLPCRPRKWKYQAGWTVYDTDTGKATAIKYPAECGLVMDVEVCVADGAAPTLATAAGTKHWYSWVSPRLMDHSKHLTTSRERKEINHYTLTNLIPLGMLGPKMVAGHNVSYDRARIKEQYLLEDTRARFLDTMSLHVCVSGITSYQRAMLKSKKPPAPEDAEWLAQSSLNSLDEVHRLYCGGAPISKVPRNIFVEGTLTDVSENFQDLMNYCASDVEATHRVLRVLYPLFAERFPHPVTFAGMLEMGSAYLPVNSNWLRYINESDLAYEDLSIEAKYHLSRRADEACALMRGERYRQNLWLWDEDWSVQQLKMKQAKSIAKKGANPTEKGLDLKGISEKEQRLFSKFKYLYDKQALLPARRPLLPGYPLWYRKLCQKPTRSAEPSQQEDSWTPGPTEIGTGMQIAPKLLSLCWEGYPLHYVREHGWGFLVPFRSQHPPSATGNCRIPIEQLAERCPVLEFPNDCASLSESEYALAVLPGELESRLGKREFYSKAKKDHTSGQYTGSGVWCNQVLEDCCFFLKLPHKNGNSFRVGNPLSKDFLNKFSENVLSSGDAESGSAARVIEIARMMSYWRNNRDRILGQMVVWLPAAYLADRFINGSEADMLEYGAICPQVVVCGTLTRRAMEPTWMTASNSQRERIGSELRAMVQAPKGYKIVGADVDSQELWIASVLGDAYACGIHGATPFGWMTLSGSKRTGTDMHSITAKAVGISRDHAKVINYARIYGAGQNFAEGLLKQFNPTFSTTEAKSKAAKMFSYTKGKRVYKIRSEFEEQYGDRKFSSYEAMKIASSCNRSVGEMFERSRWEGGTESAMFNRLEEIATGDKPVTPFLGCRLSRALESSSGDENRFLPTRVNWVVQSGAVDFLHLMLVSMRWLMGPHVRFCLSFHDELRYLVKEEMAYKAALAMHVTNLLTRSFCASRIGISDLPMSVAFFSSVEVDTVLRKESTMDCKTPSNPHGLQIGYGIPPGESLNIYEAITKAGGKDLRKWEWLK